MIRESLASSSVINRHLRSIAWKEKAGIRAVAFPVASERSNFRHSDIPFATVKRQEKNLGG